MEDWEEGAVEDVLMLALLLLLLLGLDEVSDGMGGGDSVGVVKGTVVDVVTTRSAGTLESDMAKVRSREQPAPRSRTTKYVYQLLTEWSLSVEAAALCSLLSDASNGAQFQHRAIVED